MPSLPARTMADNYDFTSSWHGHAEISRRVANAWKSERREREGYGKGSPQPASKQYGIRALILVARICDSGRWRGKRTGADHPYRPIGSVPLLQSKPRRIGGDRT